jgi:hypothetical protein
LTTAQYRQNYGSIKWIPGHRNDRSNGSSSDKRRQGFVVMSDIEPFVSPLDGKVIGSRSALREHERRHNVRQIGNDWSGSTRPDNWNEIRNVRD